MSDNEQVARIVYLTDGDDAGIPLGAHKFRDVLGRGLSVNRVGHIPKEALIAKAQRSVSGSGGKKTGYFFAHSNCGRIRACRIGGVQAFEVWATPTDEDPSHADVRCTLQIPKGTANSKVLRQGIYEEIMRMFERADISAIFGPAVPGKKGCR